MNPLSSNYGAPQQEARVPPAESELSREKLEHKLRKMSAQVRCVSHRNVEVEAQYIKQCAVMKKMQKELRAQAARIQQLEAQLKEVKGQSEF